MWARVGGEHETAGVNRIGDGGRAGNLGQYFAQQLIARGAAKVYATARRPGLINVPGVEVLHLDLTNDATIEKAARLAADTDLLVNNASMFEAGDNFLHGDLEVMQRAFDTNVFGTLRVVRAFAPVLARADGGGAILNVLSAMAWSNFQGLNVYGASKAAAWSMTNALREELAGQGTQVTGLVFGMAGTRSMRDFADSIAGRGALDAVITAPEEIVDMALDGVEAGSQKYSATSWLLRRRQRSRTAPGRCTPSGRRSCSNRDPIVDGREHSAKTLAYRIVHGA